MKKIILIPLLLITGYAAFSQDTDQLLDSYLPVKNTLVKGDGRAASEAIRTLYQNIKAESDFPEKEALLKAADKMTRAGSIEKQRAAFAEVSTLMWKVVKRSGTLKQEVYYQYCPMKKAYWLSGEKEIRNPYYGSSMLTCGKVVEAAK